MVNSDILLDDERIEMIPADGPVDVNAGPDETPGIKLDPATASLRLGGGTSDAYSDGKTFGNLRLDSDDGEPRIELSTGDIAPTNGDENAVFIFSDGLDEDGQVWLGRVGEPFSDSTVRLDARNSQITLGSQTGSGDLLMYREGLVQTLYVDGREASVQVGGADSNGNNGVSGSMRLVNDADEPTISIDAAPADGAGGELSLRTAAGTPTATIDGGTGSMTLGGTGENGTLSLRDGAGTTIELDATAGVAGLGQSGGRLRLELDPGGGLFSVVDANGDPVFQVDADGGVTFGSGDGKIGMDLDPENGLFSIVDADGDPVFQIDTQAETVHTAKGYSRGTIGSGRP